jgi:hypothetical protein
MGDSVYTLAVDPVSGSESPIIVPKGTESSTVSVYLVEKPDATGVYHLRNEGLSFASFDLDRFLGGSNAATILDLNGNSAFDLISSSASPTHGQITESADVGGSVRADASNPGRLFLGSFSVLMPSNGMYQTWYRASAVDSDGIGRFVLGSGDVVSAAGLGPAAMFEAGAAPAVPLPSAAAAGLVLVSGVVYARRRALAA